MTTVIEAAGAALAGLRMYPVGSVPASPTYPYGIYSAILGGGESYTLDSRSGVRRGLVSVQAFGKTLASAGALIQSATEALLDRRLTFDGYEPTTPLRSLLDTPGVNRDPDDNGVVTVTMPFTFNAAKEA